MKHPSPWSIEDYGTLTCILRGAPTELNSKGSFIAELAIENTATNRIIKAAPELLEALERLALLFQYQNHPDCIAAYEVIKKAKGG